MMSHPYASPDQHFTATATWQEEGRYDGIRWPKGYKVEVMCNGRSWKTQHRPDRGGAMSFATGEGVAKSDVTYIGGEEE